MQIEHPVRAYAGWKAAFDRDPARREASGVRRYRVYRPVDDVRYVIVELDFDARDAAEAFLAAMRGVWRQAEGTGVVAGGGGPQARIVECVEAREY